MVLRVEMEKLAGEVETGALLRTNAPAQPEVAVKLTGLVKLLIEVRPMPALFFSHYRGENRQQPVRIIINDPTPLRITKIETASRRFRYRLRP